MNKNFTITSTNNENHKKVINFADIEKEYILKFYKDCKDMNLKVCLQKLLLIAGILEIKTATLGPINKD